MRLAPGPEAADFDSFIAKMGKGIVIKRVTVDMDSQALNGYVLGRAFNVSLGKRVARLNGAAVLFRSPELWKGLFALGGEASERRFGLSAKKGQPTQTMAHSVTAPPAIFSQLTLVIAGR